MEHLLFFIVLILGNCIADESAKTSFIDHSFSDAESDLSVQNQDRLEEKGHKNLSLKESRRRLGVIVDRMDKDNDSKVTEEELDNWIVLTQTRHIHEEVEKVFKQNDINNDNKVHWDEYNEITYGMHDVKKLSEDNYATYKKMEAKENRKWKKADTDGDGYCNVEEFRAFLHPEEFHHMRDVVAWDTFEGIDKNGDGFVDMDEYIGDMFEGESIIEPDWVQEEKKLFSTKRDHNGDGKLDLEEVRDWLLPGEYNHANAEAKYLIYKADDNDDGELTKEEIIDHHDTFIESQATQWGETLRHYDEF